MINIFCCTLQVCAMKSNQKNHFLFFLNIFPESNITKKRKKNETPFKFDGM